MQATPTPPPPHKHALYRFYADDGALLYVGITNNPGNRFSEHQKEKPWWLEVRGISVEPYDTRPAALAAETRAIAVENPRYNKARPSLPNRTKTPARRSTTIFWACDHCHQGIDDQTGYIHIEHAAIHRTRVAVKAWHQANPGPYINGAALLDYPNNAHWEVHHATCDPHPLSDDYHFDVSTARTHAQLLASTAHLMGKDWLQHTDWDELITRIAQVSI